MNFLFRFILLLVLPLNLLAQGNPNPYDTRDFGETKYQLERLVKFKEGVNEYDFVFHGESQGFFWDTISDRMDCHNVIFNILNNSDDTLFIERIGGGDGAMLYHRKQFNNQYPRQHKYSRAVFPHEKLGIRVKHYSRRYKFSKPLRIRYRANDSTHHFSLASWGHFIEGYPDHPPFKPIDDSKSVQRYRTTVNEYVFDFSKSQQQFSWGPIYHSTRLDSLVFLIKNTTGRDIHVDHTEYQNQSIAWTSSRNVVVKPGAYYEVLPKFYAFNYNRKKFTDSLIIHYSVGGGPKQKFVLNTTVKGFFEPKTQEEEIEIKQRNRNRKILVNGKTKKLRQKQKDYHFDFAHINHGFDWGAFHQDGHNSVNFHFHNRSNDTLYLRMINNAIKNFTTEGSLNGRVIHNNDYVNVAILPAETLKVSLDAPPTKKYGFKFPFHLKLIFYQNNSRKTIRIINSGSFIKAPPEIAAEAHQTNSEPAQRKLPKEKMIRVQLTIPKGHEAGKVVFTRWKNGAAEKITAQKDGENQFFVSIPVKEGESVYGMFYCDKYHVLAKFIEENAFAAGEIIRVEVRAVFDNNRDYFYSGLHGYNIKSPFNQERKGYYVLDWPPQGSTTEEKNAWRKEVKAYLQSLGYSSAMIKVADLSTAIELEKKLRASKYQISMGPVDWYHEVTPEGWDGGHSAYHNSFVIQFTDDVSEDWIEAFFKKNHISTYRKGNKVVDYMRNLKAECYFFSFDHIVDRSYMKTLDTMWLKREVVDLEQNKFGVADMD